MEAFFDVASTTHSRPPVSSPQPKRTFTESRGAQYPPDAAVHVLGATVRVGWKAIPLVLLLEKRFTKDAKVLALSEQIEMKRDIELDEEATMGVKARLALGGSVSWYRAAKRSG